MDGIGRRIRRRKSLKERLGLKGMGCCGATWGATMDDEDPPEQQPEEGIAEIIDLGAERRLDPDCFSAGSGMNLAAALAAERHFRAEEGSGRGESGSGTPLRMSLREETETEGNDMVCCVCMGMKKGAAFIPCGHTFCRVCSRELWLNRGTCPICNRLILEILDIF